MFPLVKSGLMTSLFLASVSAALPATALNVELVGRHASGVFDEGAAEIVAWHAASHRIFVVNADSGAVDILDASKLESSALASPLTASNLPRVATLDLRKDMAELALGAANSVAVHGNLLAVAVEAKPKQADGVVAFYTLNEKGEARYLGHRATGALPDMVTFSPDGRFVIVANEGEPSSDYRNDPEGSITLIEVNDGKPSETVKVADFKAFNDQLPAGVRVFGPGASAAQDLEPEYIAVSSDSRTAFVSLQEANALAVVDLESARVSAVLPLGFKDHGAQALDASDKDKAINIRTWPGVLGMYQPDTLALITIGGKDYLLSANEGDSRDYWFKVETEQACQEAGGKKFDEEDGCLAFSEEVRVEKLKVEGVVDAVAAADKAQLGRLKVTRTLGDADGNGAYEQLYAFGARSFSVWGTDGRLLWDSGDQLERITSERLGKHFNASNDENGGDDRSDDKGPEPEALAAGFVGGKPYAFVGLERTSGFVVYDLSEPTAPKFVDYIVNRDFETEDMRQAGDLGPEGMKFVPAAQSPTGQALLLIGNEISGSTAVYELR